MRKGKRSDLGSVGRKPSQLKALLDAIPDMIFCLSKEGDYRAFIPAKGAEPYVPPDEFLGRNIRDVLPAPVVARALAAIRAAYDTGEAQTLEYSLPSASGERTHEARIAPSERDEVIAVVRDITARKRAERQLDRLNAELEQLVAERTRALGLSEARLRNILDTAADAIVAFNNRGEIESFNRHAQVSFGFAPDEVLGRHIKVLMPEPYWSRHQLYRGRDVVAGDAILEQGLEVQARRKDGTLFPVELSIGTVDRCHFTAVIRDVSERKDLERRLRESRMEERRQLSKEVHDGIGGYLTGMGLLAESLTQQLAEAESPLSAGASLLVQLTKESHEQLRQLTHGLTPVEDVPEGLMEALQRLARQYATTCNFVCRVDCTPPVRVDETTTATHLFRIAQEAVANAARHACAKRVTITLARDPQGLRLVISDDGIGLGGVRGAPEGLGMASMEERCQLLGGTLTVQSAESGGTIVSCVIPRQNPVRD